MSLVSRHPNATTAAQACGRHILSVLAKEIDEPRTLAVSGGSSPRIMFELFASSGFPWEKLHIFWVDERCVPIDDPQSNFRLANAIWLEPAGVPAKNIHRVPVELEPREAAARYQDDLREFFRGIPQFTVIHRGMGSDAHTASLFPGDPLIEDAEGIAAATYVQKLQQWRVTLLPAVLKAARHTAVLATGADKAEALDAVLTGPNDPKKYPAQIGARNSKTAAWFVDEGAATLLPPGIE